MKEPIAGVDGHLCLVVAEAKTITNCTAKQLTKSLKTENKLTL